MRERDTGTIFSENVYLLLCNPFHIAQEDWSDMDPDQNSFLSDDTELMGKTIGDVIKPQYMQTFSSKLCVSPFYTSILTPSIGSMDAISV